MRSTYLGCARRYTTERKRCGDTRGREKQAEKHKPEVDWQVDKRKVCEKARLEVKKHTACVRRAHMCEAHI